MLETSPPRSLPIPPPIAGPPAYPRLFEILTRVRRRARALHLRTALLGSVGALLILLPLPLAFADHSAFARLAAQLLPAAALLAFVITGPILFRRRVRDDWGAAALLAQHVPQLRSSLLTAVQLQRALDAGTEAFSNDLALAHIAETASAAGQVHVDRVLPRWPAFAATGVFALGALVAVLCFGMAPRLFLNNLAGLWHPVGGAASLVERLAEPITYDIELTYTYPAYTGLARQVVKGSSGEIAAPAGTEVKIRTRADRDVVNALIVVGTQAEPLQVEAARDLSGSLVVSEPGSYRFRFTDAKGHTVAEGPPMPIAVKADAPPRVSLRAPLGEVEVAPRADVKVSYEAEDDYGLKSVELVYRIGSSKTEQRLALNKVDATPRRLNGDYTWSMATLSLAAGDRVTYYVEARDNDAVAGPQIGKTKEQVIKIYSEAEHHRQALQRVEHVWDRMIDQLAETLEQPDRAEPKDSAAVIAGTRVDEHASELVTFIVDAASELRKDRSAPKELWRALTNMSETLRVSTAALSLARTQFARWARQGTPESTTSHRLQLAAEAQIAELEKDSIYLEKLLDHRRIEDLKALSQELNAQQRDLAGLLEKFQKTPDEATRAAIQSDIARLKDRIGELMQRMSELQRAIHEEHLNADAMKSLAQNNSMLGRLDKIQELMNQGKVDEAMKELQRLGDQMKQLEDGLDKSKNGFDGRQDPELSKKFQDFNDQLAEVSKSQREVEKEVKELKQAAQTDIGKRIEERGPDFADRLRQKVAASKEALHQAAQPGLPTGLDDQAQRANEALEELDRALAGKNYDAASEATAEALRGEQDVAASMRQEAMRARRYPAFSPLDPAALEQGSDQANAAMSPLQEVKKELDQLLPKGQQAMSPESRQKMRGLEKKQESLRQQAASLQKGMEDINKKAPVFSPAMKAQMQGAGQQMAEAEGAMSERDASSSASHAGEAAGKLEQVQEALKQSGKGGGGGGLLLPSPSGGGEGEGTDGNNSTNDEKVEIPDGERADGVAYRNSIMNAMKQAAPTRYEDQVKKYYEEIVK